MRRIHRVSCVLAAMAVSASTSVAFAQSSAVVISEFRTSTPNGGFKDEFIELHNTTCAPIDVSFLSVRYASCSVSDPKDSQAVAVLPANTVIQPNGFYLLANTAFHGSATADQPFAATFGDLSDSDGGIAIVDSSGKVLDAVGFCEPNNFPSFPFREGTPLSPAVASEGDWSFIRNTPYLESSSFCEPETDTGENAKDFFFNFSPSPQGLNDSECTYLPLPCEGNVGKADKVTGFCTFPPKSAGLSCDDGNGCTVHDTCDGKGNCQSGEECPDPKPTCDAQGNAVQIQSFCTYPGEGPGVCIDGGSEGQGPIITLCEFGCRDGVCNPDPCDPTACAAEAAPPCYVPGSGQCLGGICRFIADFEATTCDDGDACTVDDACVVDASSESLACKGNAAQVEDEDPCTIDSCDPLGGVSHVPLPNGTACNEDNNACNGVSACQDGACVAVQLTVDCALQAHACDIAAEGKCDPASGLCTFPSLPEGTSCSDASACTTEDKCDAKGRCAGVDVLCQNKPPACADDKTQITYAGICAGGECGFTETSTVCALGCDPATGLCVGAPCGGPCPASDNPCAENQCDAATDTCVEVPRANGKCDDGDACTVDDECSRNTQQTIGCFGKPAVCDNPPPPTCRADGKTAVSFAPVGACSAANAGCKYEELEVVCADGCDAATGKCVVASGGAGGSAGAAGVGGSTGGTGGLAGQGGSAAGTGGSAGQGGSAAGQGGVAGKAGGSGASGKGGAAGQAGKAGAGGTAGKAGSSGKGGSAQGGSAQGGSAQGGSAQGGTAQGGTAGTGGSSAQGGSSIQGSGARSGASGNGFGTSQSAELAAADFDGGGIECSVGDVGRSSGAPERSGLIALLALAFAGRRRRRGA